MDKNFIIMMIDALGFAIFFKLLFRYMKYLHKQKQIKEQATKEAARMAMLKQLLNGDKIDQLVKKGMK